MKKLHFGNLSEKIVKRERLRHSSSGYKLHKYNECYLCLTDRVSQNTKCVNITILMLWV